MHPVSCEWVAELPGSVSVGIENYRIITISVLVERLPWYARSPCIAHE
jgi:hypothetical protein